MPRPSGKRGTFTFRVTAELRERLSAAALAEGRPVSEIVEARLEASFQAADLRAIVREEMQAALAGMERLYIKSNGQL